MIIFMKEIIILMMPEKTIGKSIEKNIDDGNGCYIIY